MAERAQSAGGELEGRVAIVTGAGRGIGRGIATALLGAGASVACVDRDASLLERGFGEHDSRALRHLADVTDESQAGEMVGTALARWGRIDILVNNAGHALPGGIADISLQQWREVIDANLTSAFLCCRAVLPTMLARRSGRIINIGSQLGIAGSASMVHYAAAKAGLHGLTKSLARDVAPQGVLVNAIAPGPVETEGLGYSDAQTLESLRREIPVGRFAQVEEIAPTVLLLASSAGAFYAGAILNVSGGHVM